MVILSCIKTILLLFATLFLAVNCYNSNLGDDETSSSSVFGFNYNNDASLNRKRDTGKNIMWIGPRLGRRKRSEEENNPVVDKNTGTVLELLQESPWAFVALKGPLHSVGGKRRTVNFIPRLGRDSEEEYVDAPADGGFGKSNSRSGSQISGPYGGGNNFTPRLGRYVSLYGKDHL